MLLLSFMFGYLTGHSNPEKGEIIYWTEAPHKCKGLPRKYHGWYYGTQWKCHTCGDIWELQETFDGIEPGSEWKRIKTAPIKGKKK